MGGFTVLCASHISDKMLHRTTCPHNDQFTALETMCGIHSKLMVLLSSYCLICCTYQAIWLRSAQTRTKQVRPNNSEHIRCRQNRGSVSGLGLVSERRQAPAYVCVSSVLHIFRCENRFTATNSQSVIPPRRHEFPTLSTHTHIIFSTLGIAKLGLWYDMCDASRSCGARQVVIRATKRSNLCYGCDSTSAPWGPPCVVRSQRPRLTET